MSSSIPPVADTTPGATRGADPEPAVGAGTPGPPTPPPPGPPVGPPSGSTDGSGDGPRQAAPGHTVRNVSLAVGVVMVGFLLVLLLGFRSDDGDGSSPLDGKPAPALAGTTINGGRFDLADLRGSWVVVNFFATW